MRVLAALSGGVDSAVAAARAADAGHDVVAVHLALSSRPLAFRDGARGCCSVEDARDARRAADVLGLPFYVWDLADRFDRDVVADFVAEYAAGRTPNPCLRCNERIKFSAVLDRALALGFDAVCTGHYARLLAGEAGTELHRAVDAAKDQSYVLSVLGPTALQRAMFPLGETRKSEVRAEAARRGLLVAGKPDSHDVCFIPSGDTAGFLRERLGTTPGDIVDVATGTGCRSARRRPHVHRRSASRAAAGPSGRRWPSALRPVDRPGGRDRPGRARGTARRRPGEDGAAAVVRAATSAGCSGLGPAAGPW